MMIYLQWYRDKGRGEEATAYFAKSRQYKRLLVKDTVCGSFPVARLFCEKGKDHKLWKFLLTRFGVNAMTVYPAKLEPGDPMSAKTRQKAIDRKAKQKERLEKFHAEAKELHQAKRDLRSKVYNMKKAKKSKKK